MSLVREEVLSKPVFLVEGQGSVSPYMGKNVKNGCHSPFVVGINQELSQFIDTLEFGEPIYPIYSTSFNRKLKEGQDQFFFP